MRNEPFNVLLNFNMQGIMPYQNLSGKNNESTDKFRTIFMPFDSQLDSLLGD